MFIEEEWRIAIRRRYGDQTVPDGTSGFSVGKDIFRPVQNCPESYGMSLIINRIDISELPAYKSVSLKNFVINFCRLVGYKLRLLSGGEK